ncbi:MAG: hypothetical protein ACRYGF_10980, partial [Janthinobacterium lividum]
MSTELVYGMAQADLMGKRSFSSLVAKALYRVYPGEFWTPERRYFFHRDALRFIQQCHKPLLPAYDTGQKILVLFAHFDPHGKVDEYVEYYLKQLHA